jgi:hypothetical protein
MNSQPVLYCVLCGKNKRNLSRLINKSQLIRLVLLLVMSAFSAAKKIVKMTIYTILK